MKHVAIALTGALLALAACAPEAAEPPPREVLDHCLRCSATTEAGELAVLYEGLPEDLDELCALIKAQLIHPFEADDFAGQIPEGRVFEDRELPTVALMLEELRRRDGRGLVIDREPGDRLLVACVHHSLLLASILRERDVPCRLRAGLAGHLVDGLHVTHAVCEVWHGQRWILVDPDREKVDLSRGKFLSSAEAWRRARAGKLDARRTISRYDSPERAAAHLMTLDLTFLIGEERDYWVDPPLVFEEDEEATALLDRLAGLLEDPDANLDELKRMARETPSLQVAEEAASPRG